MTREQAYHYYNEFLWPERYADCVPMDREYKNPLMEHYECDGQINMFRYLDK